ncbi:MULTISPECIES: lysophospholipid acyltransferase family protein [unclassified Yoonia]|uniref:lysophospholipid acyltransferase family protein n=1 Tax=unclassified Yoonia TaxID=2629118 RepID=UPI002AFE79F9|nr:MULTISPECIES: lysophospholipid acyltransferase family protein [unclassified Yoonia]
MTAKSKINGSFGDRAADFVLRGLIGGVKRLPYATRVRLMGQTIAGGIAPLAGYRKRAEQHLALIYPDMPAARRRDLAHACCDNFGRTLIENYSWHDFAAHLAGTMPTGPGFAALQQAAADKRPVIFATGHFGNHEAPRQVLTRLGYTIGGLYRPMQNAFFNSHYARTMTSWGGPVFEQGRQGTMGFVRHLRGGGMGTLLFDVAAKGPALPFLGKPAHTATSIADIALRTDALVIPYFGIRQPDGLSFQIMLDAPIAPAAPVAMMLALNASLERQIAANPAQWFWVHRRWKPRKKT